MSAGRNALNIESDPYKNAKDRSGRRGAAAMAALLFVVLAVMVLVTRSPASDGRSIGIEANRAYYYADTSVTSTAEVFDFSTLSGYDARLGAATVFIENLDATDALMFKLLPVGATVAAEDLSAASNATGSETQTLTITQTPIAFDGKWAGIVYERLSADSSIVVRVRL